MPGTAALPSFAEGEPSAAFVMGFISLLEKVSFPSCHHNGQAHCPTPIASFKGLITRALWL